MNHEDPYRTPHRRQPQDRPSRRFDQPDLAARKLRYLVARGYVADNYLVFTPDRPQARTAFESVTAALATVGLRPHERKSRIRGPHAANTEDFFLIDG